MKTSKEEPNIKIVVSDIPEKELPNYECVNCDFTCYLEEKAIAHQEESEKVGKMHELWVKRR